VDAGKISREDFLAHAERLVKAQLMPRTFGFDVLACPRCGGRFRLVALIEHASPG
jgi:hypothetical protein